MQAELAQRAGCSAAMIRKIEADERKPSLQLAELLAQQLQIPGSQVDGMPLGIVLAAARAWPPACCSSLRSGKGYRLLTQRSSGWSQNTLETLLGGPSHLEVISCYLRLFSKTQN
ncbi:MAG: helix-turn-helix transcriptional regulator, partial [Chloroflexota bacterium]